MAEKATIGHQEVRNYLQGQISENVKRLREKEPSYHILFDIIDQLKEQVKIPEYADDKSIPDTFDQTEELLADIISGAQTEKGKRKFLGALYYSPGFYQRVLVKLGDLVPVMKEEIPPEMKEISMQSDEQLLTQIMADSKVPAKLDLSYKIPVNFWLKIKDFISGTSARAIRFAYATAAIMVIIISGHFGLRFYNTTWQIMQAEKLLKENYKVYMTGTPRLSGDYGSTGIAQLMDKDEEQSYLGEALRRTNQAETHGSTSNRIQELKAKIFIINGELEQAENQFNRMSEKEKTKPQVLNDLGVLKFLQKDYQASRQLFQKAIRADGAFVEAYYNLAMAEEKLGNKEGVIEIMEKLLQLKSDEEWRNAIERQLQDLKSD